MWQKLGKSYPPQFELIPLLLLFTCFYLIYAYYAVLPGRIPSHFNIQGLPDGWSGKTSLWLQPVMGVFLYLVFTVLNFLLAVLPDPRVIMNLPESRKAALTPAQVEALRLFFNRCLFALKVFMLGLITYSLYATIEVALGRAQTLGTPFYFFLAGILGLAGYMVVKSLTLSRPPRFPGRG